MTSNIKSFIVKENSVTIIFDDGVKTISSGQRNFEEIIHALQTCDLELAEKLISPDKTIVRYTHGDCVVSDGNIYYKGEKLQGYLVNKILQFARDGLEWNHLVTFLDNLQSNPSMRARDELYKFLETEDMPLTDDGHFLAYKRVRENFMDWHSNKISNSIGNIISMERNFVDDNQAVGCSKGLHAGSLEYVKHFHGGSGKILIVKINPADVVCIPNEDHNKLRCCKYEVLKEMDEELLFPSYSSQADYSRGRTEEDFRKEFADVRDDWEDVRDDVFEDIQSNVRNSSYIFDEEDDECDDCDWCGYAVEDCDCEDY